MKTSRKIKIIKILNVLDNVILIALRSYLNHHSQVKIIESKVKIVEQVTWQVTWQFIQKFTWQFIQKFRIIQHRITEFNRQFRITQHCPFKLSVQFLASMYQGLSIIIQIRNYSNITNY
jgi:hypothetical protein